MTWTLRNANACLGDRKAAWKKARAGGHLESKSKGSDKERAVLKLLSIACVGTLLTPGPVSPPLLSVPSFETRPHYIVLADMPLVRMASNSPQGSVCICFPNNRIKSVHLPCPVHEVFLVKENVKCTLSLVNKPPLCEAEGRNMSLNGPAWGSLSL